MANIAFAKKQKKVDDGQLKSHKILLIDDDPSVHEITNIAIKAMNFSDFQIEILTAFSATDAKEILKVEKNIALALVDVVMETPEAGLDLVNYIRDTLQNKLIRLIIRTGQANEFPPMQVIQHYDINDFKEKTELTLEKLYTSIRTSVKQYEHLLELQQKYEETYRQMTTNPLTKLPNRVKLVEDFSKESNQTLILIDIIGFSMINDTNGYEVGDFVLKELGGFLSSMYGSKFKVYHLNNDLFALVTKDDTFNDLVTEVESIKDDISKLLIVTKNFNKTIETTIGVAHQSEDDVMRKAELALKEARNSGRNQIKFYSSDLKVIQQISNTQHWSPIIKHAIENNGILAFQQPIYDIQNNKVEKYELLVRLRHDDTIFEPSYFLSAANYSGQLYNIFKFMFKEGCRLAKLTGGKYSINISDCELHGEGLVIFIEKTLRHYNVDPKLLSLEILESNSITQSDEIKLLIQTIHAMGIEFVIDDFGAQCSNFSQTEFLPVTTLKIDGSFIKNLPDSKDSQIIVKTIQTFAKEKGLKLVAEFVHSKEVYDKVKEFGIPYAQGYYLARPSQVED